MAADVESRPRRETDVVVGTKAAEVELPRAAAVAAADDASLAQVADAAGGTGLREERRDDELHVGAK